jgi:hypothetical protein
MVDHTLPIALPPSLVDLVVEKTLFAGEVAQRSYSEQDKWDMTAFGVLLWRLIWNHVEDSLRDAGAPVWYEENSLKFDLNGYVCSLYAGGHDRDWDVHTYDFARTPKRRAASSPNEDRLFPLSSLDRDLAGDPTELRNLTFVYCGDPHVGTAAIYLGAPVRQVDDFRWGWVRCLYRQSDGGGAERGSAARYPGFVDQPNPEFSIQPKVSDDFSEGQG